MFFFFLLKITGGGGELPLPTILCKHARPIKSVGIEGSGFAVDGHVMSVDAFSVSQKVQNQKKGSFC